MSTKSKAIETGPVEIDDDEFEPKNVKVRITTFVDQDVLKALKCESKRLGMKYQSLLNQTLRHEFIGSSGQLTEQLSAHEVSQVRQILTKSRKSGTRARTIRRGQ